MTKLKPSDFYVVIRSVGERSLPLCQKSVEANGLDYEIITNVTPFWKAVVTTFKRGIKKGKKFTVILDADVVLYQNALKTFIKVISQTPGYWRYEFGLKDRFYSQPIYGTRVHQTAILPIALENCPQNIEKVKKPATEFCHQMRKRGYKDINLPEVVGTHGYHQYYRDIFHRFFHRAVRNPEHKERVFAKIEAIPKDPEMFMAYLGWQAGEVFWENYKLKTRLKWMLAKMIPFLNQEVDEEVFFPPDAKKKRNITKHLRKYGLRELEPLSL